MTQTTAEARAIRMSRIAALLAAAIGGLGLLGWVASGGAANALTRATAAAPNAGLAVALLAAGTYLALVSRSRRTDRVVTLLAAVAGSIAALTLVQHATPLDLGIDRLFHAMPDGATAHPGRMSVVGAIGLLVLGGALLLRNVDFHSHGRPAEAGAFIVLILAMISLFGALFDADLLLGEIGDLNGIGPGTIVALALLAMAILGIHPDRGIVSILVDDGAAGREARLVLLAAGPISVLVLGLITLGHRMYWYDARNFAALALAAGSILAVATTWRAFGRLVAAERETRAQMIRSAREEARFRAVFEAAPSGMLLTDAAGVVRLANRRATQKFGFEPGTLEGVSLDDLVPNLGLARGEEPPAALIGTNGVHQLGGGVTLYGRRRDGFRFPVEIGVSSIDTEEGLVLVASVVNLTARQRSQEKIVELNEELRRSEERFLLAVRGSQDGIWDWDPIAGQLWLSDRAREQLRLDRAPRSVVSAIARRVHPSERRPVLERMAEQLGSGGELDVECRLADAGDPARARWIRIRGQAVIDVDGAVKRVAGSITDTTDLRRSIEGLEQGQKRFAVALDNHGVGFWEWDLTTDRAYRDATWLAIHGYGEGEVTDGMAWSTLEASERLAVESALHRHLNDESVPFDVEYRARRKDGSRIWIASRARVVEHDAAGRPSLMMGTVEDITRWKEFETQIEARNRELQTLLHVASHDLREPLRSILGFSHLLLEEHTEQLDEDGKDLLTRVGRAAERLECLLSEISNLARVRRLDFPTDTVELEDVVREAVGRLEHRINESGATVEVEEGLGVARAHPTWATQAVFNLVLNALKFVEPGTNPEVEIGPWKDRDGSVGVVVRDRGPGVPAEQAESIFGLFRRGVGREVEGVGAGLAIVREVAARHGGKAWVQKRPGGGSEFVITFGEPGEVSERSRSWERPGVGV